ncbi:MAG: VOC family protein [Gemmatimonadota bacterium]|nr:VOC family protein [Gemmatimonadota bacterium]
MSGTSDGSADHMETVSYHTVTPYLMVEGVPTLIEWLAAAFGASEVGRLMRPDGSLMHAEVLIGDSPVMLGEPMGEFRAMPASIYLRVDDCDATYARALGAGGVSAMEVMTMAHAGERYGGVIDPSGNIWWVASHVEDVSWSEQQRRIDSVAAQEFGE